MKNDEKMTALPLLGEVGVIPQPVPMDVCVGRFADPRNPSMTIVVLQISTHTGVQQFLMPEAFARQVHAMLGANLGAIVVPTTH